MRQSLGQAVGRGFKIHLPNDKRIEADNFFPVKGKLTLRGSCLLVLQCIPRQESIKRRLAAIEAVDVVTTTELLDPECGHLQAFIFKDARLIEQKGKTRGGRGWSVESSLECLPLFSIETEPLTIWQGLGGTSQSAFQNKITDRPAFGVSGALQSTLG